MNKLTKLGENTTKYH